MEGPLIFPHKQSPRTWLLYRHPRKCPRTFVCFFFFFKGFIFLIFFLIFIYLCIYFLTVLGLHFCARAFSSCSKWGPLFITMRGPLTIAASLVAEHRLQTRRLSGCGSQAQLLRGMWDPPRPGLEPVSPALAGRFSTTAPPGKPLCAYCSNCLHCPEHYSFRLIHLAPFCLLPPM